VVPTTSPASIADWSYLPSVRIPLEFRTLPVWGAVFALEIDSNLGEPVHYVGLVKAGPDHPHVYFQRVPKPKTLKNHLHLDIRVDDIEQTTAQIGVFCLCSSEADLATIASTAQWSEEPLHQATG